MLELRSRGKPLQKVARGKPHPREKRRPHHPKAALHRLTFHPVREPHRRMPPLAKRRLQQMRLLQALRPLTVLQRKLRPLTVLQQMCLRVRRRTRVFLAVASLSRLF